MLWQNKFPAHNIQKTQPHLPPLWFDGFPTSGNRNNRRQCDIVLKQAANIDAEITPGKQTGNEFIGEL